MLWENISRRNPHRATKMLMTLLGFLWAVLLLAAVMRWTDPGCFEKMYRLVRRPVLIPVRRPARRFLSSVLPWWFYPIMAPPSQDDPITSRNSESPAIIARFIGSRRRHAGQCLVMVVEQVENVRLTARSDQHAVLVLRVDHDRVEAFFGEEPHCLPST